MLRPVTHRDFVKISKSIHCHCHCHCALKPGPFLFFGNRIKIFVIIMTAFAESWAEEKRKMGGISDTDNVKYVLKSFMSPIGKIKYTLGVRYTHAQMYNIIKGKIVYKDFRNEMNKVSKKKREQSNMNVQKVKCQLLDKFNDPALKNAMRTYMKNSGKNFGIQSQCQKNLKLAFIEDANMFIKEFEKLNQSDEVSVRNLVEKHKKKLLQLDMYWNETIYYSIGEEMTHKQRMTALKSLDSYYKRYKKVLIKP
jgi:hypothetical protein